MISENILLLGTLILFLLVPLDSRAQGDTARATFAGGCFWCMEHPFEKLDGVLEVVSGYTGGDKQNPTYKEVSSGETDHLEAVQILYNPSKVTYNQLLDAFWRQIDPTDPGGQFVDRGEQYTSAIFYHDEVQRAAAEASRQTLTRSGRYDKPIVTRIRKATRFYKAEDYHQDYYKKNPIRYKYYKYGSGRDPYLKKMWADVETTATKWQPGAGYKKPSDPISSGSLAIICLLTVSSFSYRSSSDISMVTFSSACIIICNHIIVHTPTITYIQVCGKCYSTNHYSVISNKTS